MLDLAKDYTALLIISEIDNKFYDLSKEGIAKDAVENENGNYDALLKIEATTSNDARGKRN